MNDRLRRLTTQLYVVIFLSGFCSLVYQVMWMRLLRGVFGASTIATSAVLAIFMGGLGVGGYVIGRRLERVRSPLRLYSTLEMGIGLSAALSPWLIDAVRALYFSLGGSTQLGLPLATLLRLVLATLVLGAATVLMGGTLPAVAQTLRRGSDEARRDIGRLYGLNTLGAVAGAFISTFFLLELFGVRSTVWLVGALNVLLGFYVLQLARRWEPSEASAQTDGGSKPEAGQTRIPDAGTDRWTGTWILGASFMVGFVFFLMELVWYRMMAPVLGGSSYTFGLILVMALLGIGLGGLLYSRRKSPPTAGALIWTCILEGLFIALPFCWGDHLALFAGVLRKYSLLGFPALVLTWAIVLCVVVLPAAIISGYQFPLLVALFNKRASRIGFDVGVVYALNTAGAILGAIGGGFGLMPLLTAPHLWRLCAVLLIVVAVLLGILARGSLRGFRWSAPIATMTLTLVFASSLGPTAYWRGRPIGAGRLTLHEDLNTYRSERAYVQRSVIAEAEGIESNILVLGSDDVSLIVNGKSDGSALGDAPTMVMSGLVGAALHQDPRQALVIGLGSGTTAGWLAEVESMEHVDVIELEPAVARFAKLFSPVSYSVLESPKVELFLGDGREFAMTTRKQYDIIFSQPSNPYRAGVANLFSQDFYKRLSERLNSDGLFLQWIQGYEIDRALAQTAVSTLSSVFPHVETWQVHVSDLLMVASHAEVSHDLERLRRKLEQHPFRAAMQRVWKVEGLEGFYSGYIGGPVLTSALANSPLAQVSTDDRPVVELGFAQNVGREGLFHVLDLHRLSTRLGAHRIAGELDWDRVNEMRHIRSLTGSQSFDAKLWASREDPARIMRASARQAFIDRAPDRVDLWHEQDQPPQTPFDLVMLAGAFARKGDPRAEVLLPGIEEISLTDAAAIRALLDWSQGKEDSGGNHFLDAIQHAQKKPWLTPGLMQTAIRAAIGRARQNPDLALRLFDALERPFCLYQLDTTRLQARIELLPLVGFRDHCESALRPYERWPEWDQKTLDLRVGCYRMTGSSRLSSAEADLRTFLAAAPPRFSLATEN